MQTERQDLGYIPLLGSVGGVLWDAQAKSRLVNSNQREKGLCKLHGSLIYGVYKRSYLELRFSCDSVGCYLGHTIVVVGLVAV